MLYPSDISNLASLQLLSPSFAGRCILMRGGAKDHLGYTLQLNAIRLADHAITEYKLGWGALNKHQNSEQGYGIGFIIQASSHFETCVLALERFIKHSRALRSSKYTSIELKQLIPRNESFLLQGAEKRITRMRHSLVHLEGDAIKGLLPQGSNLTLVPSKTGLEIADHSIEWKELATWLEDMHSCATRLANYMPSLATFENEQA